MKLLTLVRHATAEARRADQPDFTRALTPAGRKDAAEMAVRTSEAGIRPDLILTSPAARALETARIFAQALGYPEDRIVEEKLLYEAGSASEILVRLKATDDACTSIMLFGHDPVFTELAQVCVKGFAEHLPKCSVLHMALPRKQWKNLVRGIGRLILFELPAPQKRPAKRKAKQKQLAASFKAKLHESMQDQGLEITRKLGKYLEKQAKRMARKIGGKK